CALPILHGDVWVKLPKYAQRLHLLVTGLLVKKDTKIKDFESLAKQAKPAGASKASGVVDLQTSIVKAVHQANDAVPEGTGPLIKWSVANGVGIHGFQIFRSDREDG